MNPKFVCEVARAYEVSFKTGLTEPVPCCGVFSWCRFIFVPLRVLSQSTYQICTVRSPLTFCLRHDEFGTGAAHLTDMPSLTFIICDQFSHFYFSHPKLQQEGKAMGLSSMRLNVCLSRYIDVSAVAVHFESCIRHLQPCTRANQLDCKQFIWFSSAAVTLGPCMMTFVRFRALAALQDSRKGHIFKGMNRLATIATRPAPTALQNRLHNKYVRDGLFHHLTEPSSSELANIRHR